jgi:hypothetical protein
MHSSLFHGWLFVQNWVQKLARQPFSIPEFQLTD